MTLKDVTFCSTHIIAMQAPKRQSEFYPKPETAWPVESHIY